MDPAPPDTKRQRLSSWSSASNNVGPSLPPPQLPPPGLHHSQSPSHPHTHHYPPPPPPPPAAHPPQAHLPSPHHQPPPQQPPPHLPALNTHQQFPPRPADHSSAPPTPASAPPAHAVDADRRHHEQEPYAPMQDPYRQHHPPPSPAHHGYQNYPPRDVKREFEDPSRRPSSTGHVEAHPSTPHTITTNLPPPPQQPQSAYPEHPSRHMNYDNAHPPTPGGYRGSYPPPTPIALQTSYDQPGGYPHSAGPDSFYGVYSSAPNKKKNTRASQACDQCRQLKAKCDETKPCKTCRDKGLECRYRDPVPKATDKAHADMIDAIAAVNNTVMSVAAGNQRMESLMVDFANRLAKIEGRETVPIKHDPSSYDEVKAPAQRPQNGAASGSFYETTVQEQVSLDHSTMNLAEDEMEVEPGPPVPPGEPAIPINHTTLNSLLLEWPAIRELTRQHVENQGIRYVSEYPISQEQSRGPLMVYGRGEHSSRSRRHREAYEHGLVSDPSDDSSDVVSSPSPAADFGQLGGLSPPDQYEYRGGVLAPDGNPDFSEAKVWSYVESFKENMLNMHPIVEPKVLETWVRDFLKELPAAQPRQTKNTSKSFAVGNGPPPGAQTPTETTGGKRKRSPGPDGSERPATPGPSRMGRPQRSIHNALVLTILALGKICQFRDYVPDIVHPPEMLTSQGSPMARNGILPSPGQGSPPGYPPHSQSSGLPSPKEQDRSTQSRRSSIHGSSGTRGGGYNLKKNYEAIPGLEYFAYATDIMGNYYGAYNDIKVVYANIFAGLYHGQLVRPMESFAFISKASHVLQVIMRPSLDKLRRMKHGHEFIMDAKNNNLALAFWTCLQLESDLIAEMSLPPSGLLSYEDDMPHPNMSLLDGFDQRVLDSYPGQLYLRTHLNSIHRMFYAPDDPAKPGKDKFKDVGVVADAVIGMKWVAPSFAFKESDPPANDILSARLRAKYWGAQGITYRPFIRQILQFSHAMKNHASSPHFPAIASEFREGINAPVIHPNTRNSGDIDREVVDLAAKGIKALVESTRAFHGLGPKRSIITNMFGTAHAQWGNLLILSAAFKDPVLSGFVDEAILRQLFQRVIAWLNQSATSTNSLRTDMFILMGLSNDLFGNHDARTTSSFSSSASVQTPRASVAVPNLGPTHAMGPPQS